MFGEKLAVECGREKGKWRKGPLQRITENLSEFGFELTGKNAWFFELDRTGPETESIVCKTCQTFSVFNHGTHATTKVKKGNRHSG